MAGGGLGPAGTHVLGTLQDIRLVSGLQQSLCAGTNAPWELSPQDPKALYLLAVGTIYYFINANLACSYPTGHNNTHPPPLPHVCVRNASTAHAGPAPPTRRQVFVLLGLPHGRDAGRERGGEK